MTSSDCYSFRKLKFVFGRRFELFCKRQQWKVDSIYKKKTRFLSLLFQFHRTYVCWVAFSLFVTTKMTLSRSNIVMIGKKWFVNLGEKWRTLTTPRLPELPMFCANLKTAPSVSKLWEIKNVWSLCFGSMILLSKK